MPNNGLIRYRHFFNAERILPVSPKALAEVLVTKNYEFIKPTQFRLGLGRILGIGILLAEGEEHKVRTPNENREIAIHNYAETTEESDASLCFSTYQGAVPNILGEVA